MKVYIVVALFQNSPKIRGVFSTKEKAEEVAYKETDIWNNVIELELDKEIQ